MAERGQSPVFTRLQDFTLWLFEHTQKFPRHERFRLGQKLEQGVLSTRDMLMRAARQSEMQVEHLKEASLLLEVMKSDLRLAHKLKLFNADQYFFASKSLMEIGKLIGGWMKINRPE